MFVTKHGEFVEATRRWHTCEVIRDGAMQTSLHHRGFTDNMSEYRREDDSRQDTLTTHK